MLFLFGLVVFDNESYFPVFFLIDIPQSWSLLRVCCQKPIFFIDIEFSAFMGRCYKLLLIQLLYLLESLIIPLSQPRFLLVNFRLNHFLFNFFIWWDFTLPKCFDISTLFIFYLVFFMQFSYFLLDVFKRFYTFLPFIMCYLQMFALFLHKKWTSRIHLPLRFMIRLQIIPCVL